MCVRELVNFLDKRAISTGWLYCQGVPVPHMQVVKWGKTLSSDINVVHSFESSWIIWVGQGVS